MNNRTTPTVDLRNLRPATDQGPDLLDLLAQAQESQQWNEADHRSLTTVEAFEAFHAANPFVFDALVAAALNKVRAGGRKPRFTRIWEEVRDTLKQRTEGDSRLMNNNFRGLYSRLIMAQEPELFGA